jgi:sugar lactone lactonase YvrE
MNALRSQSLLLRAACLSLVVSGLALAPACSDPEDFRLAVPAKLSLAKLTPEQRALLRAQIEAPGVLAPTELAFDDEKKELSGSFVISVEKETTTPVTVRVFGRFAENTTEVILGLAQVELTLKPREAVAFAPGDDDWRIDGAAIFDPNGNGISSVADLVAGFDPAPLKATLDVAPGDLQFASGIRPGEFTRQVVVVENVSGLPQELTAEVVGGQGMSIVRVDATGTPDVGAPRSLPAFTLQPFQEQLLAVTFAPTNGFLVRGGLALHTVHEASGVTTVSEISLFANSDGDPQPVLPGYDAGTLDGSAIGFDGDVQAYPPTLLFGGQPLAPGIIPLSSEPNDVLVVEGLDYATSDVGGIPASAVFLVQVPARHRISVELTGLVDDAQLGLFLLDESGALSADETELFTSANPGTSPEVVQFRNESTTDARRAVIVVGRVDAREATATGADAKATARAPFQLLAQLNAGPELTDKGAPITPLTSSFRGGVAVTIKGIGFEPGATVRFGTHLADRALTTVDDDGKTVHTVTPPADIGDVGAPLVVVVTNPDGQAATHPPIFRYEAPAPQIDEVSPPTGSTAGGTPLIIRGAFFSNANGGPNVLIGGNPATGVQFKSSSRIECTAPAGTAGQTNLVVENVSDEGDPLPSAASPFFYVAADGPPPSITNVALTAGAGDVKGTVDGGTSLTITGDDFAQGVTVRVGGNNAIVVSVSDDRHTVVVTTPPGTEGAADLVVINPDGQADVLVNAFTYFVPTPVLLNAVPEVAVVTGGTRIVVDGVDLREGVVAIFRQGTNEVPALTDFLSETRVLVTSPPNLAVGAAELFVRSLGQTIVNSNTLTITVAAPVVAPPSIAGFNPPSVAPGSTAPITMLGSGFSPDIIILVDNELLPPTSITSVTSTAVTFRPPTHDPGGAVVRVVNPDGQSTFAVLSYDAANEPVIISLSPDTASALVPGDVITLNGANFRQIPNAQRDAAVRLVDANGTVYATTVLDITSTRMRVAIDDELPPVVDLHFAIDFPPSVTSPSFFALPPVVVSQTVVAGQPKEGSAFTVLLQGVNLNPGRISAARFTLPVDNGPDVVVEKPVTNATSAFVSVALGAADLVQGEWQTALVYRFTNAQGQADSLVVTVPNTVVVAGNCGNGVIEAGEDCDSADLGGQACSDVGFFGGTLRCTAQCVLDTRLCNNCGDGIINAAEGEVCDGANLGGATCATLGPQFTAGAPGCDPQCGRLTSGTCSICGNGVAEDAEQCDGNDFKGATCADLGFNAGQISCDASCLLSGDLCSQCGNNRCDALETQESCPGDCAATCGNGTCDASENCSTCPRDCGGQCEAPYTLTLVAGGGQSARFSSDLGSALVVEARAAGNAAPLVGLQITFTPPVGGSVSPAIVLTDANGRASTQATLPRTPGAATFVATGTDPDGSLLVGAPMDIGATSTDIATGTITTLVNQPAVGGRTSLVDGANQPLGVAAAKASVNLDNALASGVVVRADGTVFFSDTNNHRVLRVDPQGRLILVAGSNAGTAGFIDNVPATQGLLNRPRGLALDAQNNLYIADTSNNRIRKVDAITGNITTFAGGGASTNEGVLATNAQLFGPSAIAIAGNGDAFILNSAASPESIRKVSASNQFINTVVAAAGCTTNNLRATSFPESNMAFDPQGRLLFVANVSNFGGCPVSANTDHVLRLENDGTLSSIAGGGTVVVTGTARGAQLQQPVGLASDGAGNVYIAEGSTQSRRIRKVTALGVISTLAGTTGVAATVATRGDGGAVASALFGQPGSLAFGPGGDLFVTDSGMNDLRVLRAIAENTPPVVTASGFGGGQSAPVNQPLAAPLGVTVTDSLGNKISGVTVRVTVPPGAAAEPSSGVTDGNGVFSFVAFVGRVPGPYAFTLSSTGVDGLPLGAPIVLTETATDLAPGVITSVIDQSGARGSTLSTSAARSQVSFDSSNVGGIAIDPDDGTLFISDTSNHRVLKVDPAGAISVVAGTGSAGNGGNGPALTIALSAPRGLALDEVKNLYIADSNNDVVRVLKSDGSLTIFAGSAPNQADPADGLVATGANLDFPISVAVGPAADDGSDIPGVTGQVFITDQAHGRIRKVDVPSPGVPGVISSVMSTGACTTNNVRPNSLNDGAIAFDKAGRVYFTGAVSNFGGCPLPDPNGAYAFRLETDGTITAVAGGNTDAAAGPAFGTRLRTPSGVAVDPAGNLYIAENGGHRIRRVDVLGAMTTIAGDGVAGFTQDNTSAAGARVSSPTNLAFDGDRNLYVVDGGNNRLRMIRVGGQSAPAKATISIVDGDNQTGTIGQLAALPIRVKIVDDKNAFVVNLPVAFAPLDLGDTVIQPAVSTTLVGEASTTVRLGRSSTTPHRFQALARTWLDPTDILDAQGNLPVFTLSAQRPASGSAVAIANSQGTAGAVPALGGFGEIAATEARMNLNFGGVVMAPDGTLFLSDSNNHRVLSVSPEGHLSVFAGTGTSGFLDNVDATAGLLDTPRGLALDAAGNLYIVDASGATNRDRVRRVDLNGVISTIAGGAADTPGHGDGAGTAVNLNDPRGIAVGPDGFIYVVDAGFNNVRRIDPVSPFFTSTQLGDGGGCSTATGLKHNDITDTGLAWDTLGRMYFFASTSNLGGCPLPSAQLNTTLLLRQELNGTLTYIAGNNTSTNNQADGRQGNSIFWQNNGGLGFLANGDLVFVENTNHRVRRLRGVQDVLAGTTTGTVGTVTTLIGTLNSAGFSSLQAPGAGLTNQPKALFVDVTSGDIYWSEDGSDSLRLLIP